MQDRVPLYPGRVMLTPVPGQENTFDMVRADSPTQEGTPLNKANLLKDATAAMFGLDATAVPDDVLVWIGNYNQHWWKRFDPVVNNYYTYASSTLGESYTSTIKPTVSSPVYISASYTTNEYGEMILLEPITVWDGTTNPGYNYARGKYVKLQNGIVWKADAASANISSYTSGSNTLYQLKVYEGAIKYTPTITAQTDHQFNGVYLQSSDRNAYPDSGLKATFTVSLGSSETVNLIQGLSGTSAQKTVSYSEELELSADGTKLYLKNPKTLTVSYDTASAANVLKGKYFYPVPYPSSATVYLYYMEESAADAAAVTGDYGYGVDVYSCKKVTLGTVSDDGYKYQYVGVPFDNAVVSSKVEIIEYTGTGTYGFGVGSRNELTFSRKPKLVIIAPKNASGGLNANFAVYIWGSTGMAGVPGNENAVNMVSVEGLKMTWYTTYSSGSAAPGYQFNASSTVYTALAFL